MRCEMNGREWEEEYLWSILNCCLRDAHSSFYYSLLFFVVYIFLLNFSLLCRNRVHKYTTGNILHPMEVCVALNRYKCEVPP